MVDSRAKGSRGETQVRDALRAATNLKWERIPGSGALDPKHGLKADLYVPGELNLFCLEVKNYEEDHITSQILTSKNPQLITWWEQAVRQGKQVNKKPLLIFKFIRSKMFVAYEEMPNSNLRYIFVSSLGHEFYISVLDDWLTLEKPKFIK